MNNEKYDEYKLVKEELRDGVKYWIEIPKRYDGQEIFIPIYKAGDMVFITSNNILMDNLKYDYPIKFTYREMHNEKALIPIPKPVKPTQTFVYEDELDQEEETQYKEGITTIVKDYNPTFTAQIILHPNNWGTQRKIYRLDHYDQVEVPKRLSEEEWKKVLEDQYEPLFVPLSDEEKAILTTRTLKELHDILIQALSTQKFVYSQNFYQVLFHKPDVEYIKKPVYVEDTDRKSLPLKDVDIDVEVVGEDYTFKTKISGGSTALLCDLPVTMDKSVFYYGFKLPISPFIYDYFNVPMEKEKKKKGIFRGGED